MNKEWFEELAKNRKKLADAFDDPAAKGTWDHITKIYTEKAHFIYELLQNADDAKATYASFKLCDDKLIFIHDGSRHFSISNPFTEAEDANNGCLGDVNSILSIGNSTKSQGNTIGKFGIGFKAVFQYTSTPYIYDSEIKFKIERYIVPILLEEDYTDRKAYETLFLFPFNHEINTKEIAFKAISERLKALVNPILFLTNLREIMFQIGEEKGKYSKEIEKSYTFNNTIVEYLTLKGNNKTVETLWLFSRTTENGLKYSVGFYADKKGKLIPKEGQPVYCYFSTQKQTGLKFIIHAPFLLNNNREGIKQDEEHNTNMMNLLAELAADSLVYLRDIGEKEKTRLLDDNIIKIVPLPQNSWYGFSINPEIKPYYEKILRKFKTERIVPTANSYCYAWEAYWAQDSGIRTVFNDNLLKQITGNEDAQWAFTSLKDDKTLLEEETFISAITNECLSNQDILDYIENDSDFIIGKSIAWIASFYKWAKNNHLVASIKRMNVFLDTEDNAVPAYNEDNKLILFLPTSEKTDYTTVSPKLLKKAEIKTFLVDDIRITMPSLKDEIYAKIIPQIENGDSFDSSRVFKKFFIYYYKECSACEQSGFIRDINYLQFVKSIKAESKQHFLCSPDTLYFPDETLREYFKVIPNTFFVDIDAYLKLLGKENEKPLRDFLSRLGVSDRISIITKNLSWWDSYNNYSDYSWKESTKDNKWTESIIVGCSENISYIVDRKDFRISLILWNTIIGILNDNGYDSNDLDRRLWVKHEYFYYKPQKEWKYSINVSELRNEKWLCTKSGEFVSPSETFAAALADEYDITSLAARHFIDFLKMPFEDPKLSNLTAEQKAAVEMDNILKQYDVKSKEDLITILEEHKNKRIVSANNSDSGSDIGSTQGSTSTNEHHSSSKKKMNRSQTLYPENNDDVDSDEFTPKTIDYKRKIERAKAKSDAEIDLIEQMEALQQKAMDAKKYSFGWFKALLDLESFNDSENRSNSREVSISFGKVELENPSGHTLVLKQPSSYIPQFMEELADIPLILVFEKDTKKLPIEVINIRSFTLRVKIKPNYDISKIPFNDVKEARITAQSPAFLLEELKNQLTKLPFADDFDMKTNLCDNIEFVFGPPGTGKTTYLANEVLIPLMKQKKKCKVLVLTPTNKAADVIALKIIEVMGNDSSYKDWLVRFGSTNDDDIEKAGIFKDKDFDLSAPDKLITITTIDRFPYDFFMPNGERHYIRNQKYDYIVFDEASMIPLVKIIYPLYHRTPEKFIIAGDPFQIEPVVSLDMWKGENIYKMVKLDSFANPKTVPHKYEVKLLTKQYRSIPAIGELFSMMTYDGILEHHRKSTDQGVLDFGNKLNVQSLNIIKFPVKKYESIYRSKRLGNKTPYHIYSALFTYEFTLWLANTIHKNNPDKNVRIGVISAYKAQADLIDRLISSADIPDTISVQTGTIHGFQGDECELIITVYNTPPSIYDKNDMFLNKQNIINVSISRARDYLFVLMPDDDTENIENLKLIKPMEQYIKESTDYSEYNSHEIEQIIFGNSEYIEENSFSTGHQNVNVYGTPEQKYEIRSENDAIDVQLHK